MKHDRRFVADGAMGHLILVSTLSLAFSLRLVGAQEPSGVQALGPELAVQALDEGIVRRLSRATEV